jgi:acid phosphatase type 7
MLKPSVVLRIGVIGVLCAGASSHMGCGCSARARAGSDGGHSIDGAAVTRLNGSTPRDSGPDGAGGAGRDAGGEGVVVAAAGDIACGGCAQDATAGLLENLLQTQRLAAVLPIGDEAYASGLLSEFEAYYRPSWGRPELLALTHPVPGNHEYVDTIAAGYFDFFDGPGKMTGIAGPRGGGYYSFDVGGWHVIALNTSDECQWVSCAAGSPQHQWLVADLAAHPTACTLAFWHHPRFQAGMVSGETAAAAPLWDALFDAGADVVLNGHEHGYQQLAPLNKAGEADPVRGIRTFVVGTGGGDYDTTFGGPRMGALEASLVGVHGILQLTLRPQSYDWRFIPVGSGTPTGPSGTAACH